MLVVVLANLRSTWKKINGSKLSDFSDLAIRAERGVSVNNLFKKGLYVIEGRNYRLRR